MPTTDQTDDTKNVSEQALGALLDIIKNASAPELWEAQTILLRRLALQGDVIASRIPAPRNISEIGGYLNLLGELGQGEMRAQMLASTLGVAGPNPPLGWTPSAPPRPLVSLANDRPEGAAQPSIPLTFTTRADFAPALMAALGVLHDKGGALPLLASNPGLPPALPGVPAPTDALPYLGRALDVVPAAALRDADVDPIALARPQGTTQPFGLVARAAASGGGVPVPASDWDALVCDASACTTVTAHAAFVPLAPILAAAGFYASATVPTSSASLAWARLTNVTGLVVGVTKLGDELSLSYRTGDILASVFATRLHHVWNGTAFVAP